MSPDTTVPVAAWADPLRVVFWVSLFAGIGLGIAWRRVPPGRLRTRLQWAGSLLFFVPTVPVLLTWNVAAPLVTLQRGLMAAYLLLGGVVTVLPLRRRRAGGPGAVVGGLVSVAMIAGGLALGTAAVRDVAEERVAFQGVVRQTSAGYRTSAPTLDIGGAAFKVTRDLAPYLREGMRVEGTATAGTRHIQRLRVTG